MAALDMASMKAYVTAQDHRQYEQLAEGTVQVDITHSNLKARFGELRLDLSMPIEAVKDRLYRHCGTPTAHCKLLLQSSDGATIATMDDDSKMLGYYGVQSGMRIHIVDDDPYSLSKNGGLEDVSLVKKYEMSDEAYDARPNTLRAWKKEKLKEDPNFRFFPKEPKAAAEGPPPGPESVAGMDVGARCEVQPGGRRGCVAFTGEVEGLSEGYWVGVKFDEPVGKGDGSCSGKSYFECDPKYGGWIRPANVAIGDFPADDFDLSDDDEL